MYGYVYITINLINNKKYIGQKKYGKYDEAYLGSGIYLKNAIKKYGKENFIKEILCKCKSKKELNEKEIEYISKYNAVNSDEYYNLTKGGDGGCGVGKKHPRFGKTHSKETRKRLSEVNKGRKHSEETKLKISNGLIGRICSEETKIKISKAHKGRKHTEESRNNMSKGHIGKVSSHLGYIHSIETRRNISIAVRAKFKNKKLEELNEKI